MNALLSLLIVAIGPDAPAQGRYPGASQLFHCDFTESSDRDFDGWPDRWTRQQGPGFPHFIKVFISPEPTPAGGHCLRIEMDGGAAGAYTPPVAIGPSYDYVVEGLVNTEGLQQDRAYLSLTVLDEQRRPLETFSSEKIGRGPGWRPVRLGPISPGSEQGRRAVIGVHVEPYLRADLRGVARFGDLWLGRLPRVSLSSGNRACLLTDPQQASVLCRVGGLSGADARVRFELCDVFGARLAETEQPLDAKAAPAEGSAGAMSTRSVGMASHEPGGASDAVPPQPIAPVRTAQWHPPLPGPGFYRVRATVKAEGADYRREMTLALIRPEPAPPRGEFGWSLTHGNGPLSLYQLGELISHVGVRWVKYPLSDDPPSGQKDATSLADLIQKLSFQGIELVGVLDCPRSAASPERADAGCGSMAEWFSRDRKDWTPALETLLTRFGVQVGWWQLGRDEDTGFVGHPRLAQKIDEIKAEFQRTGQPANLGVGWSWVHPWPQAFREELSSLRFLSLSAVPPLTSQELAAYLAATRHSDVPRWVTLQALPKSEYSLEDRVIELVQQMIAAKTEGAAAIFFADPLSSDRGMLNEDGSPGDLLMPWRTTALLLGGARPAGSITLPQGSANQVFLRDHDAVMVLCSPTPARETLWLGDDARLVDVRGRETSLPKTDSGQAVQVGAIPSFIVGIHKGVAQWQLGVALAKDRIPGPPGDRQTNELTWKNSLDQTVDGTVVVEPPQGWRVDPQRISFRLLGGESLRQPLNFVLPADACTGRQLLRADFEVRTERPMRFSVYRPVHVGPDDVRIEIDTHLNGQGELEVEQRLVNDGDRAVSFHCQLLAPDRRRETALVAGPPGGCGVHVYRLADGRQLVGKTLWLEARQTDGPRVLNYSFVVQP